ncbi:hypothetical protein FIBSPDRAFT_1048725 [Athelia psychrophila]|uniref:Fatty acid desaturase domain-containing protein n=1 Tax=Athelia psychrophila TaxID=1759441 RepID=A0A166DAJ4_9AGAM|nr:hypothetical protein FIBSPDRAFT_1048725 [Fibularhizoctonia sp. CBS 109695]
MLIFTLVQMRIAMMVGNWAARSNCRCFMDDYHPSHHLDPLHHYRDHPTASVKKQYASIWAHGTRYTMMGLAPPRGSEWTYE